VLRSAAKVMNQKLANTLATTTNFVGVLYQREMTKAENTEIVTSNKNFRIAYVTCSVIITIFRPVAKGGGVGAVGRPPIHWHPAGQVGAAARSLYQM